MSDFHVRPVGPHEARAWLKAVRTNFFLDPNARLSDGDVASWQANWDDGRIFGGYADGRWVGSLRSFGTTLSVPAGDQGCVLVGTDALSHVTVAATHRRQGMLRTMLTQSLHNAKERGEVLSALYSAEWQIYNRFGYWPATVGTNLEVALRPRPQLLPPPVDGWVRQVDPEEFVPAAAAVYERARLRRPGSISRAQRQWDNQLGLHGLEPFEGREPVCILAYNGAGQADGFVIWNGSARPLGVRPDLAVADLVAATDEAYRLIWTYLVGLDLVETISLRRRPVDEPLPWLLTDGRVSRATTTFDEMWLRLLDVPKALSARRYATTDRLVLEVDDDAGGFGQGRFTLDGGPQHAECRGTPSATPDLRMSQRALAALYLGGHTVRSQQRAGLVDEETPGAAARLSMMLHSDETPWNATPF